MSNFLIHLHPFKVIDIYVVSNSCIYQVDTFPERKQSLETLFGRKRDFILRTGECGWSKARLPLKSQPEAERREAKTVINNKRCK